MDDREQYQPAEWEQTEGSGCGKATLWILGIVSGLGVLVCCGGGVAFWFWIRSSVSKDPAVIREVTAEITEIDVPETYKPVFSMQMLGGKVVTFADDREDDQAGILTITAIPEEVAGDRGEITRQMKQSLRQQRNQGDIDINEEETEERTVSIRGKEETVVVQKGTDDQGQRMVVVTAPFVAKDENPAMLMLMVPEEQWEEEQFEAILKSMR